MCGLFLCEIIKGFHHYARILIFLSCFGIYSDFSYFFSQFFRLLMCTQCQGHLVFYFPNIWTLSFMEFQDSYNEFCRIKKFVQ